MVYKVKLSFLETRLNNLKADWSTWKLGEWFSQAARMAGKLYNLLDSSKAGRTAHGPNGMKAGRMVTKAYKQGSLACETNKLTCKKKKKKKWLALFPGCVLQLHSYWHTWRTIDAEVLKPSSACTGSLFDRACRLIDPFFDPSFLLCVHPTSLTDHLIIRLNNSSVKHFKFGCNTYIVQTILHSYCIMMMSLNGHAVHCHLQLHSIVNPDCSHLGLIKTSLMTKETSWHGYVDPQLLYN